VQTDVAALAWACLKQTYRPASVDLDAALVALRGRDAKARLHHLERRLQIVQRVGGPAQNRIAFVLDPLAEHLAAHQVVRDCGSDGDAWMAFLDKGESFGSNCRPFLAAVLGCINAREPRDVPTAVVVRLDAILKGSARAGA
jgi:hypothetical protein